MPDRKKLRKTLRKARLSLSETQQENAAQALLVNVLQSTLIKENCVCAAYLSNDGELNTSHLIDYCWQQNIQITLPVLHPFTSGNLLFLKYQRETTMCCNKYGIAEPLCEVQNVVPVSDIDVLFVPLVGFDQQGNRLGMGGGYYDRTLQWVAHKHCQIIGLAHDCQEVEELPTQSWDVPLDTIITPTRIINCL